MYKEAIALLTAAVVTVVGSGVAGVVTADKPSRDSTSCTYMAPPPAEKGAIYALSYNEYTELCKVVMGESGGEPYEGQLAVAQCILNTCRIEGKRPLEVVRDNHYTVWRPEPSESVQDAVIEVFSDGHKVLDKRVTIFYAPALMKNHWSQDHESQIYFCTIGGHKFFIERRYENWTEKAACETGPLTSGKE